MAGAAQRSLRGEPGSVGSSTAVVPRKGAGRAWCPAVCGERRQAGMPAPVRVCGRCCSPRRPSLPPSARGQRAGPRRGRSGGRPLAGVAGHYLSAAGSWANVLGRLKSKQPFCLSGGNLCGSRRPTNCFLPLLHCASGRQSQVAIEYASTCEKSGANEMSWQGSDSAGRLE